MELIPLFPIPVYTSNLERKLTKEELNTINEYKKETYKNDGNITSNDNYVLENKTLKNLKKDLNEKVINYFNKIICTSNSIIPYITQSWINYTETNQFHHSHSHLNSYVSGVFYINADKKTDQITFYKSDHNTLKLEVARHNIFNSTTLRYPVETGNVVLFPSSLGHGVERKKGTNTRISLSFNTFFKGTIGSSKRLTKLTIQ